VYKRQDIIYKFGWLILSLFLTGLGGLVAGRFQRRFGDLRDYEQAVLGGLLIILGLGLLALWLHFWVQGYFSVLADWVGPVTIAVLQLIVVLVKTFFFCCVFIWVRWTLPRFRYDQLMRLGWKTMVPLGLANTIITALISAFY
jgi:NADH:ubiquinone oxidoreductase subunit H